MFSLSVLEKLWPHGDSKIPGLRQAIVDAAPIVFPKYGITTDLVVTHAMAQFSEECGGGTEVVENLNYRATALLSQWPSHFTHSQALVMQHNQHAIANQAYGSRMGNRGGDDGWNFRGRGAAQTTGRDGYANLAKATGLDLLDNPDLVNDPAHFLECGVADFKICGCIPFAAKDDIYHVTQRLNGGQIGAAERKSWLGLWKREMGIA